MSAPTIERYALAGTDGVRGAFTEHQGSGQINEETFAGLTNSLVRYQQEAGIDGPVVVAQDTRPSSDRLRQAVIDGAIYAGAEVIDLATMPTPAAQRAAKDLGAMATVVVTASHNVYTDNGWKGMLGYQKPSKKEARAISGERYWGQVDSGLVVPHYTPADMLDQYKAYPEYAEKYIDDIVTDISEQFGELPLKDKIFVIDGANGAAMGITPKVFEKLGAQVVPFGCDPSGLINDNCGAAKLGGLKEFLEKNPDLVNDPRFIGAVAQDGDADRFMGVGAIDGELLEITGNHAIETFASRPKQPGTIGTTYTNSATRERLLLAGVDFEYCDNGDTYVTEALLAKQALGLNWTRGGEFTGHIVDLGWLTSGDGVRTAAWMAAYASNSGVTFGEIAREKPMWPEKMLSVKLDPSMNTTGVAEHPSVVGAMEQEITKLGKGRFIIRASGTEPIVRVWGESPDAEIGTAVERMGEIVVQALADKQ